MKSSMFRQKSFFKLLIGIGGLLLSFSASSQDLVDRTRLMEGDCGSSKCASFSYPEAGGLISKDLTRVHVRYLDKDFRVYHTTKAEMPIEMSDTSLSFHSKNREYYISVWSIPGGPASGITFCENAKLKKYQDSSGEYVESKDCEYTAAGVLSVAQSVQLLKAIDNGPDFTLLIKRGKETYLAQEDFLNTIVGIRFSK